MTDEGGEWLFKFFFSLKWDSVCGSWDTRRAECAISHSLSSTVNNYIMKRGWDDCKCEQSVLGSQLKSFPASSRSHLKVRWVENWMTMTFGRKKRRKVNNDYEENYWVCEAINLLSPDECGVERRQKVPGVEFCRHRRHFQHSASREWKSFQQNRAHYAQVESVDSEKISPLQKNRASIEQVCGMICSLLCWIQKICMQGSEERVERRRWEVKSNEIEFFNFSSSSLFCLRQVIARKFVESFSAAHVTFPRFDSPHSSPLSVNVWHFTQPLLHIITQTIHYIVQFDFSTRRSTTRQLSSISCKCSIDDGYICCALL